MSKPPRKSTPPSKRAHPPKTAPWYVVVLGFALVMGAVIGVALGARALVDALT